MEITFKIADTEYRVPEIITVSLFQKAVVWDINDPKNLLPFVSTLVNCPIYLLEQLEIETLGLITGVLIDKMNTKSGTVKNSIKKHNLIDFETMNFGKWVDLDVLFAEGIKKNVVMITSLIYEATTEEVESWDIRHVWPSIVLLNDWRTRIYGEWDEFFEIEDIDDEDLGEPVGTSNPAFQWYRAILTLAGEDFLKIHQVVERPFKECLNYLTWKKSEIQKQKLEQLKHKNDLRRSIR